MALWFESLFALLLFFAMGLCIGWTIWGRGSDSN
jgi:hypothetical protein